MFKIIGLFLVLFIVSSRLQSQILPKEGSKLNYRLIGFAFPSKSSYVLEIAKGKYYSEDSFGSHIIKTIPGNENRIIAEVPEWGEQYTWRVLDSKRKSKKSKPVLHHFTTLHYPKLDTDKVRIRVTMQAKKYEDAFVLIDNYAAMYDMDGKMVWFLPPGRDSNADIRDMKISPQGTITSLHKHQAIEVNYNGNVLWKAPDNGEISKDTTEYYHHEFTRLNNGHYMVLGDEKKLWKPYVDTFDKKPVNVAEANKRKELHKSIFGTIIEYDSGGKVVWYWRSYNYFLKSDIYTHTPKILGRDFIDPHENSFYFDEDHKIIYLSFKNLNRIVKLKYPGGKILNTYGEIFSRDTSEKWNGIYCMQHSIRYSPNGYIYLYNNNACNPSVHPSVIVIREPEDSGAAFKTIWEYKCTVDIAGRMVFSQGGNVLELADKSFFVSMGIPYSKIFIVNREKEILWSAMCEKWDAGKKAWTMDPQYRASIITDRALLEKLVFNTGK